jgi:homoserine O-succinyltransferase
MPVHVKSGDPGCHSEAIHGQGGEPPGRRLRIGLINNMGEAAFEATERQFVSLLERASEGISISLSLYTLRGMRMAESGGRYRTIEPDGELELDGLIVTGREPQTPSLRDEPYWDGFTEVLEWARDHTASTVWSCLAAHAAVLHMDGIGRVRSADKVSGVFACRPIWDHSLTCGTAADFRIPHSRWNGLRKEELEASGYQVLTCSQGAGVDTFVKPGKSLFVFFQGHPEYGTDSLLREYRRDVGRYLRGRMSSYPAIPHTYFERDTEIALGALRAKAEEKGPNSGGSELLEGVARVLEEKPVENTWQNAASVIYRNWLRHMCAQRGPEEQIDAEAVGCSLMR